MKGSAVDGGGGGADVLLTVAVEEYFQVQALRAYIPASRWDRFESRVRRNTERTLELLESVGATATFFVSGWIAERHPAVVREVAEAGHEVACLGYDHRPLREFDAAGFRADVRKGKAAVEQASGREAIGYRIPHGWFGPADLWALDILAEEGFLYDSSLCPAFRRFADEPWRRFIHAIERGERRLIEVPPGTVRLAGLDWPIAGGNYLRQLPRAWLRFGMAAWRRSTTQPFVMYFHVWDLDPDQPRITAAGWLPRLRQYRNLHRMRDFLQRHLEGATATSIAEHLRMAAGRRTFAEPAARPAARPAAAAREERPAERVTVVVPCYNEEAVLPYLAQTLASVRKAYRGRYRLSFVFVDDASTDRTWEVLQSLFGGSDDCRLLRHDTNRGVAAAVLTGLRNADTELVVSIDCDCSYDPHEIGRLLDRLRPGVALVTASPYHLLGEVRNVPGWRLFLSRSLSRLYRALFRQKLHTYTSCFRAYRRSLVLPLELERGDFMGMTEMLVRLDLRGARLAEVPAVLEARLLGHSKLRALPTILRHLALLAQLVWWKLTRRAGKGPAPGGEAEEISYERSEPAPTGAPERPERQRKVVR
ncbi:MAG: glycosyltransferase [Acidobacteria bacterium]|nr:MAG: glycosyltransferase [Acidobacteriota bacterium]